MALLTSLVALSIDAMLPALDIIGAELKSESAHQTHLIVSLFFIGMAFGQLFYGPFSDALGRRLAVLSGLGIFAVGTLVCAMATDMDTMLIGRVIQAFGVSGPRIASLALIRDQYEGEAMARVMSFIMMAFILVPMLAPAFGQAILIFFPYQHIFTSFLVIGGLSGLWFYTRQPETLPKSQRKPFSWALLMQSSKFILTHREVMAFTVAMGFVFGAFLAYLSASQTIFEGLYNVGDMFPIYFATLAFSIGFASFVNGKLVMRLGMNKLSRGALLGMIVMSAILLGTTQAYQGLPPLPMLMVELFILFFFIGILFGNLNSMAMRPLGEMAGLGAAIIGSLSSLFSVPIAIFISGFIHHTITPVALGFLLFGVLAAICVFHAAPNRRELDT